MQPLSRLWVDLLLSLFLLLFGFLFLRLFFLSIFGLFLYLWTGEMLRLHAAFNMVAILEVVEVLTAHEAEYLGTDLVLDDLFG